MIMQLYFVQASNDVIFTSGVLQDVIDNLPVTHFERNHGYMKSPCVHSNRRKLGCTSVSSMGKSADKEVGRQKVDEENGKSDVTTR